VVAVTTVGGYVVLTGASPSVVRAALMAAAMLVGRLGGSRAHAASALALAALVMLVAAPPVLWDVGFQLSLLATAGLIWFGPPIERRLRRWPGWIREPVALTLAAQLTTLPVILVNFERLSLVAPIANVLVVPFVPIAMLFSAIASLIGALDAALHVPLVSDAMTWFAGGAAWLVLRIIVWLGTAVAAVPHAAIDVSVPPVVAVAWLPILALASWATREPGATRTAPADDGAGRLSNLVRRLARPLPIGTGLVVVLLAISLASRPDGLLHITALDIGQGDAILVEAPDGRTMLLDGGPDPELTLRRMGATLPFFARRIDLVVLSHPHQDHVAGLVEVLDRFRVGAVLHAGIHFHNAAYERLLTDAADAGVPAVVLRTGQVLDLGGNARARVLYPTQADAEAPLPEGDINNGSVVLLVEMGGFSALLTGDAEAPIESALIARNLVGPVDVLKVGHHGSNSSTTPALVDAITPAVAVISSGEGNEYGHPAPETLATLAARPSIAVFRTDLHGNVEVETDGVTFRVRTDAGVSAPAEVRRRADAGSIGPWPSPIETPPGACWSTPGCRMGSSSTPRVWLVSPWPPPASWRRPPFRWTARLSRQRRCSTTSTRPRSDGAVASTASWARGVSRRRGFPSSPCRSPPIRCMRSSTRTAIPSAGRRSSWPWRTGTLARRS
jgi:competence protein ComEC